MKWEGGRKRGAVEDRRMKSGPKAQALRYRSGEGRSFPDDRAYKVMKDYASRNPHSATSDTMEYGKDLPMRGPKPK